MLRRRDWREGEEGKENGELPGRLEMEMQCKERRDGRQNWIGVGHGVGIGIGNEIRPELGMDWR